METKPKPGLVCWARMPIQGTEERKARPVLVVSSTGFTSRTGLVHLLPIATTPPSRWEAIVPKLLPGSARMDPKSRLITDILITEDASVLGERIGELNPELLAEAVKAFVGTLELE